MADGPEGVLHRHERGVQRLDRVAHLARVHRRVDLGLARRERVAEIGVEVAEAGPADRVGRQRGDRHRALERAVDTPQMAGDPIERRGDVVARIECGECVERACNRSARPPRSGAEPPCAARGRLAIATIPHIPINRIGRSRPPSEANGAAEEPRRSEIGV